MPDSDDGVPSLRDAAFLANVHVLTLATPFGDLDLSFVPSGTRGYEDLVAGAAPLTVGGIPISVASIDDVIRSKEAANRPKDQRTLPVLRQLRDELRKRGL